MTMYCNKFFKTEEEAKKFQKEFGYGALYKNTPRSRSKKDFMVEAKLIACLPDDYIEKHPYCVAWNEKVKQEVCMFNLVIVLTAALSLCLVFGVVYPIAAILIYRASGSTLSVKEILNHI